MTERPDFALQPLDSYRLARYSVPTPCVVCRGDNLYDADHCQYCGAPMALTEQSNKSKEPLRFVAVLGGQGGGKTVYLSMLVDMLSRQDAAISIFTRGAFSVSLQQDTVDRLRRCLFPYPTKEEPQGWNWMHCQTKMAGRRRPMEIVMPDISGAAIAAEIDLPNTFPVLRRFLAKCRGAFLIVDAERLEEGDQSPDYDAMKSISYLCEMSGHRKRGWPNNPVSIVFTKADQSDLAADDPLEYAKRRTPGLFKQCVERLRRFRFFSCGLTGAYAIDAETQGSIPLRVEPSGFEDPFVWLAPQLPMK